MILRDFENNFPQISCEAIHNNHIIVFDYNVDGGR